MQGRSFLTITDFSPSEINTVLETARQQKNLRDGEQSDELSGKTIVLLFDKPSLRTRVSFERAAMRLGAKSLYLSPAEVGLGKREPVKDVARVLSRYCDLVVCRTFSQDTLVELDQYSSIPVINGLSDWEHPCQILADLLTIREHCGARGLCAPGVVGSHGRSLVFIGDGNNVARSLAKGASSEGIHVKIVSPEGFALDQDSVQIATDRAALSGGSVTLYDDPLDGIRGADIVYTDVWTSMGQEEEKAERTKAFEGYQVTTELLSYAHPDVILMHDLPAHRGEEISDDAIEGQHSVVFDQAENRLHAQQALLWHLLR